MLLALIVLGAAVLGVQSLAALGAVVAAIADETRVAGRIVGRRAAAGTGPREAVDEVQRANVLVRARARPSGGSG